MLTLDSLDLQKMSPEELGELLISAKQAYYTGGRPIMDDPTYDTLEEILRIKAPYHRLFSKVGTPSFGTSWEKKRHVIPMGSQNKVTSFGDLKHYFELKKVIPLLVKGGGRGGLVVQPKIDGLSLEIEYQNGKLVDAITRGDGEVGDVITQNVVKMQGFVKSPALSKVEGRGPELVEGFTGSVRCEIVVTKKDFETLNVIARRHDEAIPDGIATASGLAMTYSNPRNAASGISQRLDSKYSELCTLIAVDVIARNEVTKQSRFESDKLDLLKSLGFTPVEFHLCHSFEEIENIYQEFLNGRRQSYPFDIDGLVIKINDLELAARLGSLNNRPKYQVAYKFPALSNQTTIISVTWQVGPLGTITPVAQVEPIELSGAIVTYASLANYDLIREKDLNVGDVVKISRRGDVIPHIEAVSTKVNPGHINFPDKCPSCAATLIRDHKFLKCPNAGSCRAQLLGSLRLFCDTLGILGLSDKTIAKLWDAGRIRTPGDFYKLKVEDIASLDNLGEKSAKNILHQIDQKRKLSLVEVFDAAIIPNFSKKRILQLVGFGFDTPEKILNLKMSDFEGLFGFKPTLAKKIIDGLALRRPWIISILKNVQISNFKFQISNSKLNGLSFAITGTLSRPRKDLEDLIIDHGGSVSSSVSKNTDYLITNLPAGRHGDTESNSSKFVNARKFGTKIISEAEFQQMIE